MVEGLESFIKYHRRRNIGILNDIRKSRIGKSVDSERKSLRTRIKLGLMFKFTKEE